MGVNSLPNTVTRQRRDCHLNPGPSAPESSTLTTRLLSHPMHYNALLLTDRKQCFSVSVLSRIESYRQPVACTPVYGVIIESLITDYGI